MYVTVLGIVGLTLHFALKQIFFAVIGNDGLNKLLFPCEDKNAEAVCTFAFLQDWGWSR